MKPRGKGPKFSSGANSGPLGVAKDRGGVSKGRRWQQQKKWTKGTTAMSLPLLGKRETGPEVAQKVKSKEKFIRRIQKQRKGREDVELDKKQASILFEYHKLLKKERKTAAREIPLVAKDFSDPPCVDIEKNAMELDPAIAERLQPSTDKNDPSKDSKKAKKMSAYQKARQVYEAKQAERRVGEEARERARQQREEARRRYQEKKKEKFKAICKKTKKGQPVMKGRMEILLKQIQEKVGKS